MLCIYENELLIRLGQKIPSETTQKMSLKAQLSKKEIQQPFELTRDPITLELDPIGFSPLIAHTTSDSPVIVQAVMEERMDSAVLASPTGVYFCHVRCFEGQGAPKIVILNHGKTLRALRCEGVPDGAIFELERHLALDAWGLQQLAVDGV